MFKSEKECIEALAILRSYSLIEVKEDFLSLHRLVQAVIQDCLGETGRKQWTEVAVELVNAAFTYDSNDVRTWDQCARLLPHVQAVAGHAEELKVGLEAAGHLLNQSGICLQGRADYIAAKAAFERALVIAEAVYGLDHPAVASGINNLGYVLQDLGDLQGARSAFERSLTIDETIYSHDPSPSGRRY